MSVASLADRIRMNRKSRSPVQDTVGKLFDDINQALAAGSSFRAIHAQLTREGHAVGAGHTSLVAAYKAVKRRRLHSPPVSAQATIAKPQNGDVNAAVASSPSDPVGQMPAAVVDSRRKIDEW